MEMEISGDDRNGGAFGGLAKRAGLSVRDCVLLAERADSARRWRCTSYEGSVSVVSPPPGVGGSR
jgi:hypothetical protein